VGERLYHVYILASRSRVLYTGVTGNLEQRIWDHKQKTIPGFTVKYNVTRLVYCESFQDVRAAIAREKQIKGWSRGKRIALIESQNPLWTDLSESWSPNYPQSKS